MTYISLTPPKATLRQRLTVGWDVMRGKYAVQELDGYVDVQKLADHVVEVYFENGDTVLQEWFGPDLDDTDNMIFLARHGARHITPDAGGPDLFDVRARSVRIIRRSDASVRTLIGEEIPDDFTF